ncbi:Crp/Fnr family transcriptional regulator [Ferruginivarius sediminum]|uniref:Crp/Fnr family transcriptional regulator n=2 Tax=Ferruginivarius sediminum TaxID=2661937 RepID=A0A369TCL4_9PROT|nr:Crp/Fnr family transcriptional regulator [Ferruginivarius sediminum]
MEVRDMSIRATMDPRQLGTVSLFEGLDDRGLERVLQAASIRKVAAGQAIFEQEDAADTVFVMVAGHAKVAKRGADGQETVIGFINPWEMMGCVAVCGGTGYPGTATAVEDSWLLAWSRATIERLMDEHSRIARNALSTISGRLQSMQTRLHEVSNERVERRIAHTLRRLADASGRDTRQGREIAFPITRQDLAEMTGTTLHTVSRTLSAWHQQGIVESARQRIIVRDASALERIAESE